MNEDANQHHVNPYVLAHVESVSHNFVIGEDGARTYTTTIQFVRGIFVKSRDSKELAGEGTLDQYTEKLSSNDLKNTLNTVPVHDLDPSKNRDDM